MMLFVEGWMVGEVVLVKLYVCVIEVGMFEFEVILSGMNECWKVEFDVCGVV